MPKFGARIIWLVCFAAVAGCTTNTSIANLNFSTQATLELAVGTLHDAGGLSKIVTGTAAPGTYLNAVSSFRNQYGNSAFLNPGTATLSGPGGTFSPGPLYSYGEAPGLNGVFGLPPAYPPAQNSSYAGFATGFIFSALTATPGTYTLADSVPVNGSTINYSATATLAAATTLGPESAPTYVTDGAGGGGTFTVTVPAGVTEEFVTVYDDSTPPSPPMPKCTVIGTQDALVLASGTSAIVPDGTLIQGNKYCAFSFGVDYRLIEDGPPSNQQPSPTLANAGGTVDMTASPAQGFTQ